MNIKGLWGCDRQSGGRCEGIYSFTEEGMFIEVYGQSDSVFLDLASNIPVVYGEAADGKYCTLLDCKTISSKLNANGTRSKKMQVGAFFRGGYIENSDNNVFKGCKIVYDNLVNWMAMKALEFKRNSNGYHAIYRFPLSNPIYIETIKAKISFTYFFSSEETMGRKVVMSCVPYVDVTPDNPMNTKWFIMICNKLNHFLSILCGSECRTRSVQLETVNRQIDSVHCLELLDFHSKQIVNITPYQKEYKGNTFIYKKDICNLKDVLDAWFSIDSDYETVVELFNDSYKHAIDAKWTFLNLVYAADAIHKKIFRGKYIDDGDYSCIRKSLSETIKTIQNENLRNIMYSRISHGNEYSLRDKLIELVGTAYAELQTYIPDVKEFAKFVSDTRNSLSHGTMNDICDNSCTIDISKANIAMKMIVAYYILKKIRLDEDILRQKYSERDLHPYVK